MTTPVGGYPWRDGLAELEALIAREQAGPVGLNSRISAMAVKEIIDAVWRFEDDTDESIRSALWEEAVANGEYDEEG